MKKLILLIGLAIGTVACQKEESAEPAADNTQGNTNNNTGNTSNNTGNTSNNTGNTSNNTGNTSTPVSTAGQTILLQGKLQGSGSYTVSGDVKVYEDKDKKRSLVFENFSTSAGPDLRLYLAEDTKATGFIEITDMVKNGNAVFALPNNTDITKKNHMLVWCKKFSVLFGSAQLK
jgi:hypothetical protein